MGQDLHHVFPIQQLSLYLLFQPTLCWWWKDSSGEEGQLMSWSLRTLLPVRKVEKFSDSPHAEHSLNGKDCVRGSKEVERGCCPPPTNEPSWCTTPLLWEGCKNITIDPFILSIVSKGCMNPPIYAQSHENPPQGKEQAQGMREQIEVT